ncbi:hypothetical protein KA062_00175 [Patescibacteria group bacterium]|nr:hypothetical protein [Patescibacteria group bacterium]HNV97667.1 hypothetical protein [bacterium]
MKRYVDKILLAIILLSVAGGVFLNIKQQASIDRSKLPTKVEEDRLFQRWITNIKNNDFEIEADEFKLKEESEIYNTTWMTVYSSDDPKQMELYEKTIEENKGLNKVVFNPNERIFIDYRNIPRGKLMANEVRLYGLKEDKILDARILDCSTKSNCYFDRAYFLDNDVFVISEFSRNVDKRDNTVGLCDINLVCSYTIKVHVIDIIHNKRWVYESKPFDAVLPDLIFKIYEEKI